MLYPFTMSQVVGLLLSRCVSVGPREMGQGNDILINFAGILGGLRYLGRPLYTNAIPEIRRALENPAASTILRAAT